MNRAGVVLTWILASHAAAAPAPPPVADPVPDPAVAEAGDANLETKAVRSGIVVTLGIGGAVTLGFGVNDSTGSGGAGILRVARVASPRSLIALELVGSALFHQVKMGDVSTTFTNQVSSLLVGGQYYVNPALWLRVALGFGRYFGDDVLREPARDGEPPTRGDVRLAGPAGSAGAGLDLIRYKRFRVGVEICSTAIATRDGLLSSSGFLLGFSVD
ncbi:MAG: hypothetical protein M3680_13925 [Myxococcota bacterium]|nr:hypothetical protein [Myxococcota bacterium]